MLNIIEKLVDIGERQGKGVMEAAKIVKSFLDERGLPYMIEPVDALIPRGSSKLVADGVEIDSRPTSFVGGKIEGTSSLTSSLISSKYLIDVPNINFNPSARAISRSNFYFAPSIAIRADDVGRLVVAKSVRVEVKVRKTKIKLPQILVGKLRSPKAIIFSHFDSIGPGAIDNASGVAVCLSLIESNRELLDRCLFVFDPNEELSYDHPTYWGHGYREFERRHKKALLNARKVIVVDCVGNGDPKIIRDRNTLNLAFPIADPDAIKGDLMTIGADITALMSVYHSDDDLQGLISEESLIRAKNLVLKEIRKV